MWNYSVIGILSLTTVLAPGCGGSSSPDTDTGSSGGPLGGYGTRPNGTGIHVGSTQPESWFGLTSASVTWYMTGFAQDPDGSWRAKGWYSLGAGVLSADAQVVSAAYNGTTQQVQAIRTEGSRLSIDLSDDKGSVTTLEHAGLVGLTLSLRVPDPTGLIHTNYQLRISDASSLVSQSGDLYGYQLDYAIDGVLSTGWSSYCKGPSGASQRSVFYQGAQWNPMNGARTSGANLVTTTCESGSVARCMSWGYQPWASANTAGGQATSLRDHHQACIHMKRASYCGDSHAYTVDGTSIYINDQLAPPINSGSLDITEALWTTSGALCVSTRRHPEIPFIGCSTPLPRCSASTTSSYLLATGLPGTFSSLGVLD